jgi:hypothetical protein
MLHQIFSDSEIILKKCAVVFSYMVTIIHNYLINVILLIVNRFINYILLMILIFMKQNS